jgi:hypothetical protein
MNEDRLNEIERMFKYSSDALVIAAAELVAEVRRLRDGITELIEKPCECAGFHTCERDELRILLGEENAQ